MGREFDDEFLAGEPSPDLLEQLARRRRDQRRHRAGLAGLAAAVVLIGAGIPVGVSLTGRAAGGPANRPEVALPPSVSPEVVPATPAAPATTSAAPATTSAVPATSPAPTTSAAGATASAAPRSAVSSAPPTEATVPAGCPDLAILRRALPADGAQTSYRFDDPLTRCTRTWAVAFPTEYETGDVTMRYEYTQLFRYIGGRWTTVDRGAPCAAGTVPAAIRDLTCNTN